MIEALVQTYGYLAIFIGSLFEGETVAILGGFLAHKGYLLFLAVTLTAFLGSFIGDQFWFFIGRTRGKTAIKKFHFVKNKVNLIHKFIGKYEWKVIFFSRFAYGFRTITPIMLGMSKVKTKKFVLINMLGALLWANIFCFGGYLLGELFKIFIGKMKYVENEIILIFIIAVILVSLFQYIQAKRRQKLIKNMNYYKYKLN